MPTHRELAQTALKAGGHIHCEGPLGRDRAPRAQVLRNAASAAGLPAVVSLQARQNPALRQAATLIANGAIGRVLTGRLYSETAVFGPH